VPDRPYLLVSCAMSVDGHIDDAGPARLILSGDADADRVDEVRAGCDAILVGARTIRRDNPRLLIRSAGRRAARLARGAAENPIKITITASGNLDPAARFFAPDGAAKLVYCARPALAATRARLSGLAEVIDAGDSPSPALLASDLAERGVARVLLEGGGELATEFLAAGLADELHLVIAPFFVGDSAAPRFAGPGRYPHSPASRMQLAEVRQLDDVVLLRYLLGSSHPAQSPPAAQARRPGDHGDRAGEIRWLRQTIELLSAGDDLALPHSSAGQPPSQAGQPGDAGGSGAASPAGQPGGAGGSGAASPAGQPGGAGGSGAASPAGQPAGPAPVDIHWLRHAIELSRRCPPSQTAFSVGAAIVAADGTLLATGFSREADPRAHAEETALAKVPPGDPRMPMATLYSSLEPCGVRASRPRTCAELIIASGLRRVVYAWREPPLLATGGGDQQLRAAGAIVIEVPELAPEACQVNAHLTGSTGPSSL
jgi:5-amino-6-(5-phosphoribosylamino)uracil reductase